MQPRIEVGIGLPAMVTGVRKKSGFGTFWGKYTPRQGDTGARGWPWTSRQQSMRSEAGGLIGGVSTALRGGRQHSKAAWVGAQRSWRYRGGQSEF